MERRIVTYRDFITAFRKLRIDPERPVIVHASLSAFGYVQGGAKTVAGALLAFFPAVMAPTFTYMTMVTPETGPENNAIRYGARLERNRLAQFFRPELSADPLMGIIPETLRQFEQARRSTHPILSFTGVGVDTALEAQSLADPLAPIRILSEAGGYVLQLGVGHTTNTSIHYGERLAGRRTFTRWALTPQGIRECPGFPGCSDGFAAIEPHVRSITRRVQVGSAQVRALPIRELVETARWLVVQDPRALLCSHLYCERCAAARTVV